MGDLILKPANLKVKIRIRTTENHLIENYKKYKSRCKW